MANQANFDFDDFASKLQAAIVKAVSQGTKGGSQTKSTSILNNMGTSKSFVGDMKKAVDEYGKAQQSQALANKAKQLSLIRRIVVGRLLCLLVEIV